jgi:hypothetical protein
MNNRFFRIFFSLFLGLLVYTAQAQQGSISISGKITATEDGQPVQQASISIERKGVGTSTNIDGLFALFIPATNLNDTLKVSCIGFKTKQLPIAGLKNGESLKITLEKNTTELKEVTVAYHDPLKIIQKAIARIPDNYIDHAHILRGFYRMYTYSNTDPLQLSEAVFDVYNFGYGDKRADLFRLMKARNEKNDRDLSALELGQKPNTVFEADIVNHISASGFLNDEGLKKHTFEVKGIVDFQGFEAYEIDFKEKSGLADATFRGRMFIDTKSYAFIYFDFGLSPTGLSDPGPGNILTRAMLKSTDVQVSLKKDRAKVSYQQVGNKWVLANVTAENNLAVKSPDVKDELMAHVKFNYQVTAVDTVAKESFSTKFGRNENINDHESNAGPEFWNDYNILLSDYNTEDIFKQIQVINSLGKLKDNK